MILFVFVCDVLFVLNHLLASTLLFVESSSSIVLGFWDYRQSSFSRFGQKGPVEGLQNDRIASEP